MIAMPLRILLLGGTGQLGRALRPVLEAAGTVHAPARQELDLTDTAALRQAVIASRPDVVVNAAAWTDVDGAEQQEAAAHAVNAEAPAALADATRQAGALLIHYSTDYVFDGALARPYREDDPTAPLSAYGRGKRAGEAAVQARGGNWLVLRTGWLYSAQARNFMTAILARAQAGHPMAVVDDQVGAPTPAAWVAQATGALVAQYAADRDHFTSALLHVGAAGQVSRHGWAQAILDQAATQAGTDWARVAVRPIASHTLAGAPRPAQSALDSSQAASRLGWSVPEWRTALPALVNEALATS
ncbi:dTDP-4-dehydrorhamnose reductase [plant metagenome]|uniref:dTDP-4-dehydrorhamnose reductase n=3 Tax=root TaxID=1 RepID=A0A1C3K1Q8_9BURK|nr:dTDP-4-dehydrorhamnose reductase [Orrella dioscoreae]SOE46404.1 dTDP-4-dehydrorhamnose reductase [Orrella dioscoreae]